MPCTAWADQKWSTIPRSYLDIKDKELKEVIGFYKNEQPVTCGIKSCRAIHRKGCIIRTADNVEICIGHICGSNIFDERFEVLAQKIEEDVNTQIYKDVVLSQKNKVFEYWIKAAELTAGTNGLHKIAEKITSMKNPDIVGRYASTELVRMASSGQTKVTTVRYIDEKGITDSTSEHEKQKIEHVVIGEIHNIDALSIDNDLGNLYLNEVEHVILALENIDVNEISTRQLRNIGRRVSMLDKRIEFIRERLNIAIKFLSKRNLMPMYNKMYQMDVVSRKDLGLYKAFIDAL